LPLPSEPQFAPADPSDGRAKGEFKTDYSRAAQAWIYLEGLYLAVLLAGAPLLLYLFWRGSLRSLLDLRPSQYHSAATWAEAWLGGLLGGTVLSIKWLYHSVARGLWHADRRLWRIFTPHLAGALAFAMLALITSGLIEFLNNDKLRSPVAITGLGFIIGLFADNATARMAIFADRAFGTRVRFGQGPQGPANEHDDARVLGPSGRESQVKFQFQAASPCCVA
jgi:hypothetical protein